MTLGTRLFRPSTLKGLRVESPSAVMIHDHSSTVSCCLYWTFGLRRQAFQFFDRRQMFSVEPSF